MAFRYLEAFQPGELAVHFDQDPLVVTYTLFQVRSDGSLLRVGPEHQAAVKMAYGAYYATGRAGESGQPGSWAIRWEWQVDEGTLPQSSVRHFEIDDAAATCGDTLVRQHVHGWT